MKKLSSRVARTFVFFVGVYLTYLVLMNALLESGGARAIVNRIAPNHVRIDYARAYSFWFLRVHTTKFVVRGTDSSVEWRITLDEAVTSFNLVDFFSRRVHMHDAWARGVSTRIRFKLDPSEATPDYVAKLPPIEGLPDPPLKPAVMPPVLDDAHYNLWTAQVDDVVAEDVREVWTDAVRVTDTGGSLRGGFYLKPLRSASVRPTEMHAQDAMIQIGNLVVASELHATVNVSLDAFDMQTVSSSALLRYVDVRVLGSSKIGPLEFLDPMLAHTGVTVASGEGGVELSVELARGVISPGGQLDAHFDAWTASMGFDHVSGTTSVHASTSSEGPPLVQATLETHAATLHHRQSRVATANRVDVAFRSSDVDLSRPIERWTASVDLPAADVQNLATLDAYIGTSLFESGAAHVRAHANIDPTHVNGNANVELTSAKMRVLHHVVTANGNAEIDLARWDPKNGRGQLSNARLDLRDVAAEKARGWWANLATGPVQFETKHPHASMMVTGKCRDATVPLEVLGASRVIEGAVGKQGFTFSARASISPTVIDAPDVRAFGDSIDVNAHYHADARGKGGAVFVTTSIMNFGFTIEGESVSVRPFASRDWYDGTISSRGTRADRSPR